MCNPGHDDPLPASSRVRPGTAQVPGDVDYEPDPDTVDEYELLGEETESGYVFDPDAFSEAADRAAADPPDVSTPSGAEIKEFRVGPEAHWGGNLAALLAYLQSINPAAGDKSRAARGGRRSALGSE